MLDAEKLSPTELRKLADKKEKENHRKVIKTGRIKHDLYVLSDVFTSEWYDIVDKYYTEKEVDVLLQDIVFWFERAYGCGQKMRGYLDPKTDEIYWCDQDDNEFDDYWAATNITDITDIE